VALLTTIAPASAEAGDVTVTRLSETLYQLSTDQGSYTTNSLASVGADGLLLVDTQSRDDGESFRTAIASFGKGDPKIIINTHRHVEHVGGNELFGDGPVVIAHGLVRSKLRSGSYLFDEFPDATLPDITLTDSLSVHFNGEEIRITALAGSHDDNEIIVHFTGSKVVHLSSLANGFNFPSVDRDGDVLKFAELVADALDMLPDDVVIVSGHNRNGTMDDLRAYHDMLVATTALVRSGLADGQDVDTMKADGILDEWSAYAGSYVSTDAWIDTLVEGLRGKERKQSIFEPLYHAYSERGPDAAVALYRDLKRDHADDYQFRDIDLLVIGDKLLALGRLEPAMRFLELSLREYPDSPSSYYTNYDLAIAHDKLGHPEQAIRYCEAALELNPDSTTIAAFLQQLKSEG